MKIEYISACYDGSGYGSAARNNILALHKAGVEIQAVATTFERAHPDLGEAGKLLQSLARPLEKLDARIVHLTPDLWASALKDKPKLPTIGYAVWEASKIPPLWTAEINTHVQELWVPSRHNVEAFKASGVTVPVYCVPHCFEAPTVEPGPRILPESDHYRFLSIFQWIERKGPGPLLKTYLSEFNANDKVSLVLKTYIKDGGDEERAQIKGWINELKAGLRRASYPRIELITRTLSSAEMNRLHRECDCFVLLHRGEGFGIPIAEAMLAEKPVIVTGYGGPEDFVPPEQRVEYSLTPCYGMPWPQYSGDMWWAEPDCQQAAANMRLEFAMTTRPAPWGVMNRRAAEYQLSFDKIGTLMRTRLEALCPTK